MAVDLNMEKIEKLFSWIHFFSKILFFRIEMYILLTLVGTFAVRRKSRHGENTKTRFSSLSGLVSSFTTFFNNILTCFPNSDFTDSEKLRKFKHYFYYIIYYENIR